MTWGRCAEAPRLHSVWWMVNAASLYSACRPNSMSCFPMLVYHARLCYVMLRLTLEYICLTWCVLWMYLTIWFLLRYVIPASFISRAPLIPVWKAECPPAMWWCVVCGVVCDMCAMCGVCVCGMSCYVVENHRFVVDATQCLVCH